MSSLTNSSMKPAKKQSTTLQTLQGSSGTSSIRTSLLPQTSLTKAAGVSHLSDKNNFGVNALVNLQKQQTQITQQNASSKKKDLKINNDYYTVQNTRNTSMQSNTQLAASRNVNNNLATQKDTTSANTVIQDQSITFQQQQQHQNPPKIKSPKRGSSNNVGLANVLDEIAEKCTVQLDQLSKPLQNNHNALQSHSQMKTSNYAQSTRQSIITDKKIQRALSQVKTNGILSNFTQATNFSKSNKQKNTNINTTQSSSSHPYTDRNSSSLYKKSLIVRHNKERNSPKLNKNELTKNPQTSLFRSPQQIKKISTQINESTSSNIQINSNSNSPVPSNNRVQHSQTSKSHKNNNKDTNSISKGKQENTKSQNQPVLQQSLTQITIPVNQIMPPSCLQIDLSSLSNKNEEETNQAYGVSLPQNTQTLFTVSSNTLKSQKQKQRQQTSISQNKKKALNIVSQSPNIQQLQGFPTKSPKTFRQNNNGARHSVKVNKAKVNSKQQQESSKTVDTNFKNQKSYTQKLSKTQNAQTLVQTINAPSSFDKKFSLDIAIQSQQQEEINDKPSSVYDLHQDFKKSENQIAFQELVQNFSFNSKNNKSICDPTMDIMAIQTSSHIEPQQMQYPIKSNSQIQVLSNPQSSLINENTNSCLIKVVSQKSVQENNRSSISRTAPKQIVKLEINDDSIDEKDFLHSMHQFIDKFSDSLFNYELKEINDLKDRQIYFISDQIKHRNPQNFFKSKNSIIEKEIQKKLDDEEGYYNVVIGDHLMYRYEVLRILGKGSFAQVVSCLDHKTNQKVAIKITRNTEIDHKFAGSESKLLNFLMQKDPNDSHNVVRLIDEFYFRDHHCFVFELLYTDLFEHLKENGFIGFELEKIRNYAIQILEALTFLENLNIIHCDLKPENILLRDEQAESLKLVDYGSGCFREEQVYTYVQSRFYRAPEVILRIPYSEKVDIWSFGCILAELYTGEPLFPGNNEQEQLELIMEICGIPPDKMIDKSRKKDHYFDVDYSPYLIEDEKLGILRIPESRRLEDAVPCQDSLFLDFLRHCLQLDPQDRSSAKEAMQHQWIQEAIEKKRQLLLQANQPIIVVTNISSTNCLIQVPSQQQLQIPNMTRRREEEQDGVKGNVYEESPVRIIQDDKPKKSLNKHMNFQTIKVVGPGDADSSMSTPGKEGGISKDTKAQQETQLNFQQIQKKETQKTHTNPNSYQRKQEKTKSKGVKMIGKYEIVRQEEQEFIIERGDGDGDTNSRTSGIATEANIPPVNQHDLINHENTINKITITFYQKRTHNKK